MDNNYEYKFSLKNESDYWHLVTNMPAGIENTVPVVGNCLAAIREALQIIYLDVDEDWAEGFLEDFGVGPDMLHVGYEEWLLYLAIGHATDEQSTPV